MDKLIPKILHTAWFGRGAKAVHFQRCMATWSAVHPDWQIIETNEDNLDPELMASPYMQGILGRREFVKATELARLWALYKYGGIYLDCDVRIVKPLDDLRAHEFFIGRQDPDVINGAVIGSVAGGATITALLKGFPLGTEGLLRADQYGPIYLTTAINKMPEVTVLAPEFFYPYNWNQEPEDAVFTDNTHCVHEWAKSWVKPEVSIVVAGHHEGTMAVPTLRAARRAARGMTGAYVEVLGVVDRGDADTLRVFKELCDRVVEVDNGDLGLTRNAGVRASAAKYVAFCDADDMLGTTWVRDAHRMAESGYQDSVLHTQWWFFFGDTKPYLQERVGSRDDRFDPDYMTMTNPLGALCFASRETLLKHPYKAIEPGFGYEDWQWNLDTLAAGIAHRCVPDTIQWIRVKRQGSMCAGMRGYGATVLPTPYFDNRPPAARSAYKLADLDKKWFVAEAQAANQLEPLIQLTKELPIKGPDTPSVAAPIWNGVAATRMGGAVILVTDWSPTNQALAAAIGARHEDATVIVTDGPIDLALPSKNAVMSLAGVSLADRVQALQTILVQRRVSVVHCINNTLGLVVLRKNPLVIRRSARFYFWSMQPLMDEALVPADVNFTELPFCWQQVDKIFVTSKSWEQKLRLMYGIPAERLMVLA